MRKTLIAMATAVLLPVVSIPQIAEAQTSSRLSGKQQTLIPIAAFTANGDVASLKIALNEGLDAGLTLNEIKEVLVQLYAYCGFPRSLNALGVFSDVQSERQQKGITDVVGKEASPFPPAGKTSLELGTKVQTELVGAPVAGGVMAFAPAIDVFLKAHLFGDIFGRDNLDWQSREIATISALASMEGVASQLQSHLSYSMGVGLTAAQLEHFTEIIAVKVGKKEADAAAAVLKLVLQKS